MSGLGILFMRRGSQSHPTAGRDIKQYNRLVADGKAYIVTNYYPSNYDYIKVSFLPKAYPGVLLGARTGMGMVFLANNANYFFIGWQSDSAQQIPWSPSVTPREFGMINEGGAYKAIYKAEGASSYTTIKTYSGTPSEVVSQVPLYICSSNAVNSSSIDTRYFNGYIYSLQVRDSRTGELKVDLVPASLAGVAGLFDKISGEFYGNSNTTGTFSVDDEN